jgi:pimeloyl-ACP methyl ester carboxylesterase
MKNILLLIVLVLNTVCTLAQQNYPVAINTFQGYYNTKQADSIFNMFSPKMKSLLPLDKTVELLETMHTQLGDMKNYSVLTIASTQVYYKTTFTKSVWKLMLALNNDNQLEGLQIMPYQEVKPYAKDTDNISINGINGTLVVPAGNKKVPVVLVIAGSGATDRNGNNEKYQLNTNNYRLLAAALETSDIASLRYDKRGVGNSVAVAEESINIEDMVNDAAAFIKILKADKRFSKVYVLGHSEGSLIGMLAIEKEHADGFISAAGAGERADLLLGKQLTAQSKEMGVAATILLDSLANGHRVTSPPAVLADLFHASVQPYLISWFRYDPQQEIKKLKMPVLIVQGNADVQVGSAEAEMLRKAKPDAILTLIDQMNHILKDNAAGAASYTNPDLPLKKEFMAAVISFIKNEH